MNSSKFLIEESPLQVLPSLAVKIGLNEAIVLQQIHYWIGKMNDDKHYKDGHYWIWNSVANWQEQFPFWSYCTIQRTIANLEQNGLLIAGNYNSDKRDRTKWFRIDYVKLNSLDEEKQNTNMQNALYQNDKMQDSNLISPLPESTPESTHKEIYKEKPAEPKVEETDSNVKVISIKDAVKQIYNAYPRKLGKAKGVEYILAYLGKGRKVAGFGNIKFNHEELYCAVKHYSIECERNETESDFIKHFSTFMNKDIIDYVDLAKEKGYEDYMERTYGSDWRKVKFVYKQ